MLLQESLWHLVLIWIKCAHKWKLDESEIKRNFLSRYKGWTHRKGTSACRPNDHHLQVVAYKLLNQVTRNHKKQLPVGLRDSELPPLPSLFILWHHVFVFCFLPQSLSCPPWKQTFFVPFDQKQLGFSFSTWKFHDVALIKTGFILSAFMWNLTSFSKYSHWTTRVPCVFIIITMCNGLFSQKTRKSALWLNRKIYNLLACYLHFSPTLFCILLNILPAPAATISCHLISQEVAPTVDNDPDECSSLTEPSSVGQSAPTQVQRLSQCVCSALPQLSVFCHFLTLRGWGLSGAYDTAIMTQEKKQTMSYGYQIKLWSDTYFSTEHRKQIDWFFGGGELMVLLLLKQS